MGTLKVGTVEKANGDPVDLTNQSSAKVWLYHTAAAVIGDSFNVSSVTDNGTGDFTPNFTNAMTNSDCSLSVTADTTGAVTRIAYYTDRSTTSFEEQWALTSSAGATESAIDGASSNVHGDLA